MKAKLRIFLSTIVLISLLIPSSLVLADGMVIKPDPYSDKWDYLDENDQQAFINYENDLEKMIIGIDIEKNEKDIFWLFPVPGNPNKVAIDVVDKFPSFNGEEINKKAKSNLDNSQEILLITQIYPFVYYDILNSMTMSLGEPEGVSPVSLSAGVSKGYEQDITVYERLDKKGITTEIITAKKSQSLYEYLQDKNLKIKKDSIPVLDKYIGKDYTFVISWIKPKQYSYSEIENNIYNILEKYNKLYYNPEENPDIITKFENKIIANISELKKYLKQEYYEGARDAEEYLDNNLIIKKEFINLLVKNPDLIIGEINTDTSQDQNQKGIFVTFPTEKIYYPLLPTSIYGNKTIPITLRIIGWDKPEVFNDIDNYTETEYYLDNYFTADQELKNFYSNESKSIKYTKIKINAPSKMFTEDLWASNNLSFWSSFKLGYSSFIGEYSLLMAIILLMICSIIASIIIGLIVFKELRNKKGILKLITIGLFNCLSIIGLIIATIFTKTKNENEDINILIEELRQKKYRWKRKLSIFLLLIVSPILFFASFLIHIIIISLLDYFDYYLLFILVVIALLLGAFVFALVIKKIKLEDKPLFVQLKSAGYSSWTFIPKDKMKWVFVPLFSVSFLIISYLIIQLIKLSL